MTKEFHGDPDDGIDGHSVCFSTSKDNTKDCNSDGYYLCYECTR